MRVTTTFCKLNLRRIQLKAAIAFCLIQRSAVATAAPKPLIDKILRTPPTSQFFAVPRALIIKKSFNITTPLVVISYP